MIAGRLRTAFHWARHHAISIGLPRSARFTQPLDESEACRRISFVVAVHNSPEVTRRCISSLEQYARTAEVILVDDGSTDPVTRTLLKDKSTNLGWPLVVHLSPLGHSRACEAGARLATREFLCLLNSDTYVTPWGWAAIVDTFLRSDRTAVVGPSTSWATTEQRLVPAMHCRHFWTDSQIVGFADRHRRRVPSTDRFRLQEISGFAFFIRRAVWVQFGGFNPELKDYGNEAELCERLIVRGWSLVWVKAAYIHHFGQQSYSRLGDDYIANQKARVALWFKRRNAGSSGGDGGASSS